MISEAVLSDDKVFRYLLLRRWGAGIRYLVFVMLNPSTADAEVDDHTARKCMEFARRLGFDGILVVTLFAYRATDPDDLAAAGYPVGPMNDNAIQGALCIASSVNTPVVCAWGAQARGLPRVAEVEGLLKQWKVDTRALRILADGTPGHPLMLPYSCTLEPYKCK